MDNMNEMNGYYPPPYQPEPKNNFATAAMVLGIISLLSICTVFLPIPLGALGILFAILSKRKDKKMETSATTGLLTSFISLIVGVIATIMIFVSAFNLLLPENRELLNQQFERVYGVDFEKYIEQYYGEDFSDYLDDLY